MHSIENRYKRRLRTWIRRVSGDYLSHMPQPLPNPRTALWYCAARLSQCESASRPPAQVRLSHGYARAPRCAVFRSSIIFSCPAFFRLSSLAHGQFIALKASALIQDGVVGIKERLVIGNLLVMDLPRIRLTQVAHSLSPGMHHYYIRVAVGLMFATVVRGLFFRALRALPAAVRPINDQFPPPVVCRPPGRQTGSVAVLAASPTLPEFASVRAVSDASSSSRDWLNANTSPNSVCRG